MMSKGKKIYVTRTAGRKLKVKALEYLKEKKAEDKRVEDYYTQADGEQEASGRWFDPSGIFGLDGGVADGEFTNIFAGRHPHVGSPLGPTVDEDRMGGMEFAVSPPKPFSVFWSAGNSDQRAQIVAIHDLAVERTILYLQDMAARTRTGAGGQGGMEDAKIIAALYGHRTSREADPQVHTHVAFANIAHRGDGQLRTLEFKEFLNWRGAASAYYRVAICEGLETMGVRVAQDGRNFTLPDVPQALCEDQSTRRNLMELFHVELRDYLRRKSEGRDVSAARPEIVAFAKEWRSLHGSLNWRTMALDDDTIGYGDAVALATRASKPQMTQAELEAEWAEKRAKHNFDISQVLGKAPPRERLTAEGRAELVRSGIAELAEVSAVIEEREIYRLVAERAQGLLSTAELEVALIEARAHKDLIELAGEPGKRLYSTPEAIERVAAIVQSAKRRSMEDRHQIDVKDFLAVLTSRSTMNDEQRDALAHAAKGRGICVIEGRTDAGKNSTMDAVREMHEHAGYDVIGCAFNLKAAEVLEESSSIPSSTIHKLLAEIEDGVQHMGPKTCTVVDEAGLVNSAHGAALLQMAEKHGAKILLVGDTQQLLPIQVGAAMAQVRSNTEAAIVQAIVRQRLDETDAKPTWRRDAVADLAAGRVPVAIDALAMRDKIHLADYRHAAVQAIVDRYREILRTGDTPAVLARSNEDVKQLNDSLREAYRAEGKLGVEVIEISSSSGTIGVSLGERLMTGKNDNENGLVTGSVGVVTEIRQLPKEQGYRRAGHAIVLQMDDGSVRVIDTRAYRDEKGAVPVRHAYAMTICKSRRVTVDRALAYGDVGWNRRDAYVGLSRHRIDVEIFANRQKWKDVYRKRNPEHQGEISDTQLHQLMAKAWSRKSNKAHALDYLGEDHVKQILEERQAARAAVAATAKQQASERSDSVPFDQLVPSSPPTPTPTINRERAQQIRQLVKRGKDPRHVIVTANDADTRAAQKDWPEATIAQLREGYGLSGHFTAVQAIRRADRVTILEHPSQAQAERQHVLKVAAHDGRKVELRSVEEFKGVAFHQEREELVGHQRGHDQPSL